MTIKVNRSDFEREIVPDRDPDASYLEQEGFEDRRAEYRAGGFGFVGMRASIELHIPHGGTTILQKITSPGLWGIEDDSGNEYFAECFAEEANILADMLQQLGVEVED